MQGNQRMRAAVLEALSMSQSTAARLISYARELRHSIRHYWEMERRYPDRAPYCRGRRKVILLRACRVLQWAREELGADKSPRSHLVEMDMQARREAAE
jgi:hypothetical protein